MNTPAHAIINLLLFPKQKREKHSLAIIVGAVLPDAPMLVFYLWERFSGLSERAIWRDAYFDPGWQAVFNTFHSFPLLGLACFAAWWFGRTSLTVFFASMFLHSCFDFPFHHSDAHQHFFPFSNWQFHSPVSYWEPAYHGQIVGSIELIVVVAGGAWLLRTAESRRLKLGVSFILFLYLAYWGFVSLMWM
ncbi:MAG: hypothetical protein Q9M27_04960 [Mariprofundaceae bacterium]|nr:hypothetical protein [Mariprofundaceae bacterium]